MSDAAVYLRERMVKAEMELGKPGTMYEKLWARNETIEHLEEERDSFEKMYLDAHNAGREARAEVGRLKADLDRSLRDRDCCQTTHHPCPRCGA